MRLNPHPSLNDHQSVPGLSHSRSHISGSDAFNESRTMTVQERQTVTENMNLSTPVVVNRNIRRISRERGQTGNEQF